jgi:hypothetical protein
LKKIIEKCYLIQEGNHIEKYGGINITKGKSADLWGQFLGRKKWNEWGKVRLSNKIKEKTKKTEKNRKKPKAVSQKIING